MRRNGAIQQEGGAKYKPDSDDRIIFCDIAPGLRGMSGSIQGQGFDDSGNPPKSSGCPTTRLPITFLDQTETAVQVHVEKLSELRTTNTLPKTLVDLQCGG